MKYTKESQVKKTTKKRKPKNNRKAVVKKLDDTVREILQKRDKECCCCGRQSAWFHPQNNPYGLQVGHYVSRKVYAIRWDLRNVHAQCSGCNYQHNNDPVPYTRFMLDTYGKEILDELTFKRKAVKKFSTKQLEELLDKLVLENL